MNSSNSHHISQRFGIPQEKSAFHVFSKIFLRTLETIRPSTPSELFDVNGQFQHRSETVCNKGAALLTPNQLADWFPTSHGTFLWKRFTFFLAFHYSRIHGNDSLFEIAWGPPIAAENDADGLLSCQPAQ